MRTCQYKSTWLVAQIVWLCMSSCLPSFKNLKWWWCILHNKHQWDIWINSLSLPTFMFPRETEQKALFQCSHSAFGLSKDDHCSRGGSNSTLEWMDPFSNLCYPSLLRLLVIFLSSMAVFLASTQVFFSLGMPSAAGGVGMLFLE